MVLYEFIGKNIYFWMYIMNNFIDASKYYPCKDILDCQTVFAVDMNSAKHGIILYKLYIDTHACVAYIYEWQFDKYDF